MFTTFDLLLKLQLGHGGGQAIQQHFFSAHMHFILAHCPVGLVAHTQLGGLPQTYAHAAENDYPAMECSKDDMQGLYRYEDGRINVMVVHTETIARDDGWESPELGGAVPDGRIYIHQITHTYYEADFPMGSSDLSVKHTTVIGDRAYFFIPCH